MTPPQAAFNKDKATHFFKAAANLERAYFDPRDVSKSGCDPAVIGVGRLHVFAPHVYLGFALPPCPNHGWHSVDESKVTTKRPCRARRVYAVETDEWVAGQVMLCKLCQAEKQQFQKELDELTEYYEDMEDDETAEEIAQAEAKVKAKHYLFRSYNPTTMKLYAQRYPG